MIRSLSLLVSTLVIGLTLGCANPADDKPKAAVSDKTTTETAKPARMAAGTHYTFSDESTVQFVGSKITGSHDGGFTKFDGEIVVVDGDPTRSRVSASIDTRSLWADNEKLTTHLKSADFFDVELNPEATFTSTRIDRTDDGFTVTGNLNLHGVEKSIQFPAAISVAEGNVTVNAEFVIERFDFAIEYKGKADDLIRDEVVIKLDLTGVPAAS